MLLLNKTVKTVQYPLSLINNLKIKISGARM